MNGIPAKLHDKLVKELGLPRGTNLHVMGAPQAPQAPPFELQATAFAWKVVRDFQSVEVAIESALLAAPNEVARARLFELRKNLRESLAEAQRMHARLLVNSAAITETCFAKDLEKLRAIAGQVLVDETPAPAA